MPVRVLRSHDDIRSARAVLRERGLSCLGPSVIRRLRERRLLPGVNVGDPIKSWDVLLSIDHLRSHLGLSARVLDLGAYASELPCALHRLGFTTLTGYDIDPRVVDMPYADRIEYRVADFNRMPAAAGSFDAVTAISVIEHGYAEGALLAEVSRVLRVGGHFVASFDYWPEKIETRGRKLFGVDWRIFSEPEVSSLLKEAERRGFVVDDDVELEVPSPVIEWGGYKYTFAWLALVKGGS